LDLGLPTRGIGTALDPFNRLLLRLHLPQPEAGDQLLCLGEGPVDHGPLPSREPDARALRARVEPLAREHHAGLHQLFVELPHLGKELLVWENARLCVLGGLDQHHESHRRFSFWFQGLSWDSGRFRSAEPRLYLHVEPGAARSTGSDSFYGKCASFPGRTAFAANWAPVLAIRSIMSGKGPGG